jgi:hypothetical protein
MEIASWPSISDLSESILPDKMQQERQTHDFVFLFLMILALVIPVAEVISFEYISAQFRMN